MVNSQIVRNELPVIALLTRKALQVINVGSGTHDHFESGDDFAASRAVTRAAE